MIRNAKVVAAGFLLAILSSECAAKDMAPGARKLFELSANTAALDEPAGRDVLVSAVSGYCDEVRQVFPTNSPADAAWLDQELSGGGDRPYRALGSAEWGRSMANIFTTDCGNFVLVYNAGRDGHGLAGLTYAFTRFIEDAPIYAKLNKVDPDTEGFPFMGIATLALAYASLREAGQPAR